MRAPSGDRYEVVARGENSWLGEHVVLRAWQTFPVTRTRWVERCYEIVDGE